MLRFVRFLTVGGRACFVNPATVALIEEATVGGKLVPDQTRLHLLPILHPIVVYGQPTAVANSLADSGQAESFTAGDKP